MLRHLIATCAIAALLPVGAANAESGAAAAVANEASSIVAVEPPLPTDMQPQNAPQPDGTAPGTTGQAGSRDWRDEIGTFRVGLVRGWSSDMSTRAIARLEAAFGSVLSMPVRVVTFERFASLIDAQAQGAIDYAVYSARAYAAAQTACECLDVLMQPTHASGATGQRVFLIGDATAVPTFVVAPETKLALVGDRESAAAAMLRGQLAFGARKVTLKEPFWQAHQSVAGAFAAYAAGEVDAFAVALPEATPQMMISALSAQLSAAGLNPAESRRPLDLLWSSPLWTYGPHAVRNTLATEPRAMLSQYLAGIDVVSPPLHGLLADGLSGPMRPVQSDAYRPVRRAVQALLEGEAAADL
jgi:phosphonate transport system substrate-binding protein